MKTKIKIVHYINQFFGQIGGEQHAGVGISVREGAVGPGLLINSLIKDEGEIVATIIGGDNYFAENIDEASKVVLNILKDLSPDVFIAGPAFCAGRYGLACGELCKRISQKFGILTITGMFESAPATEMYKKDTYIVKTGDSAKHMRVACEQMMNLIRKLNNGKLVDPKIDNYVPRGIRLNTFSAKSASCRALDALLHRVKFGSVYTEVDLPKSLHKTIPASPVKELQTSCIALVSTGGIVPMDNPDKLKAHASVKYGKYSISGMDDLIKGSFKGHHGGYFNNHVNEDPDRMIPVDAMRMLEREGFIGGLYDYIYTLAGTGTSPEVAEQFASSIAVDLKREQVDAVLITST